MKRKYSRRFPYNMNCWKILSRRKSKNDIYTYEYTTYEKEDGRTIEIGIRNERK